MIGESSDHRKKKEMVISEGGDILNLAQRKVEDELCLNYASLRASQ